MLHSQSGSTASTTALHHADTKSTLAQDDENNSDATAQVETPATTTPESLSSDSMPNAKLNRNRAKAKSDHAKYEYQIRNLHDLNFNGNCCEGTVLSQTTHALSLTINKFQLKLKSQLIVVKLVYNLKITF